MSNLNDRQLAILTHEIDQSVAQRDASFSKVIEASGFGHNGGLSNSLRWRAGEIMKLDQQAAFLGYAKDGLTRDQEPVTLERLIEATTERLLSWSPEHSTNPIANEEAEYVFAAQKNVLRVLNLLVNAG
tara:strand:+ start:2479 stop:2865 length:387 start_codon:yes stop_codon:yes gene_type:complete